MTKYDPITTSDILASAFAAQREAHDARVAELLDANNRFEQRARLAERELDTANRAMRQMAFQLGDLGRERDKMRSALQRVIEMDYRSSGTTSEDHTEFDGPCGEVAREGLR